jgi:hypothetical protein
VRVQADSVGARDILKLNATDPINLPRINSTVIPKITIPITIDPRVYIHDNPTSDKPGVTIPSNMTVQNFGNVNLNITRQDAYIDFNENGCSIFTRGYGLEGCLYRAEPTVIQNSWETLTDIPTEYNELTELIPGDFRKDPFTLLVPSNWAGMEDTTYTMNVTVTSGYNGIDVSKSQILNHTVIATKESSVRYIGLEIHELINKINATNTAGIKSKGALPIALQAMERTNNRALSLILDGNLDGADNPLSANIKIASGFKKQLAGLLCNNPSDVKCTTFNDWDKSNDAIIADLKTAIENDKPSADLGAPAITSKIAGTLGNNEWYTSNVTVSWEVTNTGSPVTSKTGCNTTVISSDTVGTTLTCTSTSAAGGTNSQSVFIKRDHTNPDTKITGATDDKGKALSKGAITKSKSVTLSFTGSDNIGVKSFQCKLDSGAWSLCTSPITYKNLKTGAHTFNVKSFDEVGNSDGSPAVWSWK